MKSIEELLKTQENQMNMSRDLGDQIPTPEDFGETEAIYGDATEFDAGVDGTGADDPVGTPITFTGQSFYTQQAVAAQLVGMNTGR